MRKGPRAKAPFLNHVSLDSARVENLDEYPFNLAAVAALDKLDLSNPITVFVGENGSGKSTLIEAIAVAAGFNPEGGTKNFNFSTRESHSQLSEYLRLARFPNRESDGFFLRAESFFNVATKVDTLGVSHYYGGRSLHEQSHGESFLALVKNRFGGHGLYILDEPEAALSPQRQLGLLMLIHELIEEEHSQFIIATHSPILMAYPGACLYHLDEAGIGKIDFEDTEHYQITRNFLNNPKAFLSHLLK